MRAERKMIRQVTREVAEVSVEVREVKGGGPLILLNTIVLLDKNQLLYQPAYRHLLLYNHGRVNNIQCFRSIFYSPKRF